MPPELAQNASKLMLRLRLNALPVLKTMQSMGAVDLKHDTYCFNFHLSLFIDEVGTGHMEDEENNKLIRVDWKGLE